MIQFDEHIFQDGLVQPTTTLRLLTPFYGDTRPSVHDTPKRAGKKQVATWHPMTFPWSLRGTPKWIVYNGKPYFQMDDLGGKPTIFGHTQLVPDFFLVFDTPFLPLHATCDTQVPRGHSHKTWTCRWAGCGMWRYMGFRLCLVVGFVVFDTRIFDKVYIHVFHVDWKVG